MLLKMFTVAAMVLLGAGSTAFAEPVIELSGFPIVIYQGNISEYPENGSMDTHTEEFEEFLERNTERYGAFYWKNILPDTLYSGRTADEYIAYLQSDVEGLEQQIFRGQYQLGYLHGDRAIKHAWECGILSDDVCGELNREQLLAYLSEISATYDYPVPIQTENGVICVYTGEIWQFGGIGAEESWEYEIWRRRMKAQYGEYYEVRYGFGVGCTHSNQAWNLSDLLDDLYRNGAEMISNGEIRTDAATVDSIVE